MKKLLALLIFALSFASLSFAQTRYGTYANDRFAFSVLYPSGVLKMQPPPENNDGRTFLSYDSSVEMRVWGQYNALNRSLREEYVDAQKAFDSEPSYKVLGNSSFVVSGIKNGKIFYQKTLYRKSNDAYYTLTFEYPQAQRKKYDPIVTRISKSFRLI
jgi:hypothetical protein